MGQTEELGGSPGSFNTYIESQDPEGDLTPQEAVTLYSGALAEYRRGLLGADGSSPVESTPVYSEQTQTN